MDGILASLSSDTVVMHDHNSINYSSDYRFQNTECIIAFIRLLPGTPYTLEILSSPAHP